MRTGVVTYDVPRAPARARFGVPCTEHNVADTRLHDRAGTHQAWLQGDD